MTGESQLSDREREVLRLAASGATNQQIANELHISVNTVKVHLRNIFSRIGAVSRTDAVMYAVRAGIVPVGETAAAVAEAEAEAEAESAAASQSTDGTTGSGTQEFEANGRAEATVVVPTQGSGPSLDVPRRPLVSRRVLLGGGAAVTLAGALAVVADRYGLSVWKRTPEPTVVPTDRRWREVAPLPTGRSAFAFANLAIEGKQYLYAIGGEASSAVTGEVLRYDPAADLWVSLSPKPSGVSGVRAAVVGGSVFVPGGRMATGAATNLLEAYDPQRDLWQSRAPMPGPRCDYALAAVEGKLYVVGGWDGTAYCADVWQYNPDDDTWSTCTRMPTARAYAAAGVADQQVFIVGGQNQAGRLGVNERYSPSADRRGIEPWATKAPIRPVPVDRSDAVVIGSLLLLVGADSAVGRLLIYNLQTDSWDSSGIPLPGLRDARVQAIGGKMYIAGGTRESGASARVFEYQAISTVFIPALS